MNKIVRSVSKRAFPVAIYDKAAQLPNSAMVEEAAAVDYLSEEQLAALADGEVKWGDEYIISSNLHASIDAACSYLQILEFERFLTFAIAVLKSDKLIVVHKYVAERLFGIIHPKVYEFFANCLKDAVDAGAEIDEGGGVLADVSRKYMIRWNDHMEKRQLAENSYETQRNKQDMNKKKIAEGMGIATLEAAVRGIGGLKK
jgi:hypothetical protein